jgi:CheY-like chemotaxis protein
MSEDLNSVSSVCSVGDALIVSDDQVLSGLMASSLQPLAVRAQACRECSAAELAANTKHFLAIVVDVRLGIDAFSFLEKVRFSRSNQTTVTFAITCNAAETSKAFAAGASFVLPAPVSPAYVVQTLQSAYGLMMREHRRYFRCPLSVEAKIKSHVTRSEMRCKIINVSEGGMAIHVCTPIRVGEKVDIDFCLPDHTGSIVSTCEICWYDGECRAGLRFDFLSFEHRSLLQAWLARSLEQTLPKLVVQKFEASRPSADPFMGRDER